MQEIAKVTLENELDLILAHRRSMKLAELAGLSLPAQTTFATAVSEVSRNIIESGKCGCLILNVENDNAENYLVACLKDEQKDGANRSGLEYAKRLVSKYKVSRKGEETNVELFYYITPSFRIDLSKLDEWRSLFRNEPPISAYDELKRKNEQLQELSEKVQKSDEQYRTLTNSLPMMICSLTSEGQLVYTNDWLWRFTGQHADGLNKQGWEGIVHEEDYPVFSSVLRSELAFGEDTIRIQARFRQKSSGSYLWHQLSFTPLKDKSGTVQMWTCYIVDIHAEKMLHETLRDNIELKDAQAKLKENQKVMEQYIGELNRSNLELQQFAFVASHDLQEPVRKMLFYSDYLSRNYADKMDEKGELYLQNIQSSSRRMRDLIHDVLLFSQVNKEECKLETLDLNTLLKTVLRDHELAIQEKAAIIDSSHLPAIKGDERMMRQLFGNIISNALKYAKEGVQPCIKITSSEKDHSIEVAFRDNGIGFDEKYLTQIFHLFQRLHTRDKYEGTGLGLAICRKIADMHGGSIRAESHEGEGSCFYITLPAPAQAS